MRRIFDGPVRGVKVAAAADASAAACRTEGPSVGAGVGCSEGVGGIGVAEAGVGAIDGGTVDDIDALRGVLFGVKRVFSTTG